MANYIEEESITFHVAHNTVSVAIAEAEKLGVRAVVTVVDPKMVMVTFGKADGATPHSIETSRRKANSAGSTRKATGWMSESLALELPSASGGLLTNVLGGVPLVFDGVHVGGLGVAGGSPEQDADIARATLAAIGADPL